MRLFLLLTLFTLSINQSAALERTCLTGRKSLAMAFDVDAHGTIHWARIGRLDGALYYGTLAPGEAATEEIIANNVSRSPNFEVTHIDLISHSEGIDVCFPNAISDRVEVASKRGAGWSRAVVESGIDAMGCGMALDGDTLTLAYSANGVLKLARRDGSWQSQIIDATEEPVGERPSVAKTPLGMMVAHRAGGDALRLTWWDGSSWISETPSHGFANGGLEPALVIDGDQVSVYHGIEPETLNVSSDVLVLHTTGALGGPYFTSNGLDDNMGGTLDAARSPGGRLDIITRQLVRSALFGSSDGLLIYTEDLNSEYLISSGEGQQRILVRVARVTHDPFELPVFASVDDRSAYLGNPADNYLCFWRPEDADEDRIPDEMEADYGTDPGNPDTDGDGRTDGEEVLIDGTDPLEGSVCSPVAETCNNVDDDCDGQIDEGLTRACYNGPAGTRNIGACSDGTQGCSAGSWWACSGATLPTSEVCNGVDDDCDGDTDEGIDEVGGACSGAGVGRCGQGTYVCTADGSGLDCLLYTPREEICDGVDDDCDGEIDEGTQTCGVGACERTSPRCQGGADAPCVPGDPAANDATCNGVDDDCDGFTDENALPYGTQCGVGVCRATGQMSCQGGAWIDSCVPGPPAAATDLTCDGLDDDCDGAVDDDVTPDPIECGLGVCRASGSRICQGGAWRDVCTPGAPLSADDATCDGIDDDCDGEIDEDAAREPISCGVGACAAVGERHCWEGEWLEVCEPGPAAADDSACDDIDNDCDGQTDEDYPARQSVCGVGACAALGMIFCQDGAIVDTCAPGAPTGDDTDCDGEDDDCDGEADEGYVGRALSCGLGECYVETTARCVNGFEDDQCQPAMPTSPVDEICDGLDEDCDGQVDEDIAAQPILCGVGACRAQGARSCVDGAWEEACQPGQPAANDATCDGVDDDCDGQVDEDAPTSPTACGVGACASTGTLSCVAGEWIDSCREGPAAPNDRGCDGIDADCDGQVDEDFTPTQTTCGVGACADTGTARCVNGAVVDDCAVGQPAADDATCDGVDDDCDGLEDEDFPAEIIECGVGACLAVGGRRCEAGVIIDECVPGQPANRDRTCDGVDDDCDGRVDENARNRATECGLGACYATGVERCVDGAYVDDCAAGAPAANDATCDGVDDDCDGQIDEDFEIEILQCGFGACASEGQRYCEAGVVIADCEPGQPTADDATCDGIDNDCDGQIDEDAAPLAITCGLGVCERDGQRVCQGGRWVEQCTPGGAAPADTLCDGRDEDCDGQIDEDVAPNQINCGLGACRAEGEQRCVNGGWVDDCTPAEQISPMDNICDGVDEDCDGQTDEDVAPIASNCGVGECARQGQRTCELGRWIDTCEPGVGAAQDLICDGRDEDCDGLIDEDYPVAQTACGLGECASEGQRRCVGGAEIDDCAPSAPPAQDDAVCDGRDEDCDGQVDEDAVDQPITCGIGECQADGVRRCEVGRWRERCTPSPAAPRDAICDGLDEDCDGQIDEDFEESQTTCGVGACLRDGWVRCQAGAEWVDCQPGAPAGGDEVCDGVDEDCDGQIDEDALTTTVRCGVGACETEGSRRCLAGQWVERCEPGPPALSDDDCDGVDDNCDGAADEGFQEQTIRCGVGACEMEGQRRCLQGEIEERCEPGHPAEDDALCDGVDGDCDGQVDEDALPTESQCGLGVCVAQGERACVLGAWRDSCEPAPARPFEMCNDEDDDCDGETDEEIEVRPLTCGLGLCFTEGIQLCADGEWRSECEPLIPQAELDEDCDGLDEDCDGQVDEDTARFDLLCGIGACEAEGERFCDRSAGEWIDACFEGLPGEGDATCDGIDDDCDGEIDEDVPSEVITCGVGRCVTEGILGCIDGVMGELCEPLEPLAELDLLCDGLDEDCDGEIDEDVPTLPLVCGVGVCAREGTHSCREGAWVRECQHGAPTGTDDNCNGLDDDCDGQIDEGCFEDDAEVTDVGGADGEIVTDAGDAASPGDASDAAPADDGEITDVATDGGPASDGDLADGEAPDGGEADMEPTDGGINPPDGFGAETDDGPPRRDEDGGGSDSDVSGRGCGCDLQRGADPAPLSLMLFAALVYLFRRRRA